VKPHKKQALRCAIYTRKSSEEGLEPDVRFARLAPGGAGQRGRRTAIAVFVPAARRIDAGPGRLSTVVAL